MKVCYMTPSTLAISVRDVPMRTSNDEPFDVISQFMEAKDGTVDVPAFKFITEYINKEMRETLDVYICYNPRGLELNRSASTAIANYFDTNEAFDVYGDCVIFAVNHLVDELRDFSGSDFNTLFYAY